MPRALQSSDHDSTDHSLAPDACSRSTLTLSRVSFLSGCLSLDKAEHTWIRRTLQTHGPTLQAGRSGQLLALRTTSLSCSLSAASDFLLPLLSGTCTM